MSKIAYVGWERQYLAILQELLDSGDEITNDRTGVGTRSLFRRDIRVDLQVEFPLMTTKRMPWKHTVAELLWIMSGSTNEHELAATGCKFWREWATTDGNLGPIYGAAWRRWPDGENEPIDQLTQLILNLRARPSSRRHVISAWNVAALPDECISPQQNVEEGRMALAPCHCLVQFRVVDGMLDCCLYQRSCDIFLGVPVNIASYALLTHLIARLVGLDPGEFIWSGGDVHLYSNHQQQALAQLARKPKPSPQFVAPYFDSLPSLFLLPEESFMIHDYEPFPAIKAPVAI